MPALFPAPAKDAFPLRDIGLSGLLLTPLSIMTMALHECGHWLAARAIGLRCRFGVDRRLMLLVFETDLTQVWSVPRKKRYAPLLGGIVVDVLLLSIMMAIRILIHHGVWQASRQVDAITAVMVYLILAGLLWQCMVFLRTDLYALLVNLLRCHNLWRTKTLLLRQAFGRLTPEQAIELANASTADKRTAYWFRWVWLAGFIGVLGWFLLFVLPVILVILRWTTAGTAAGPLHGQFWYHVLFATLALGPYALAAGIGLQQYARRLLGRPTP
jgi:hypothetical protein